MHDLYLGTDGHYVNQNIALSPLPTLRFYRIIFCMVSSGWTTRGSSDLLQNRTHQLTRNDYMFLLFSFYYARHQITAMRNLGNPALVFQHLSFQSYHVIHQQEHNTVDWRTVEKTQQNWGAKRYFSLLSLKYTTQAHSYKNQMFLRLKYKPT